MSVHLTTVGDVRFLFDHKTSEIVVEAYECEIGRVKANDLFLAYDRKVCSILKNSADYMMRHGPIQKSQNSLPVLKDMLDKFGARLLKQREQAWTDGDKLATVVQNFLDFKGKKGEPIAVTVARARDSLIEAVNEYCDSQGWNGPAGRWAVNKAEGIL